MLNYHNHYLAFLLLLCCSLSVTSQNKRNQTDKIPINELYVEIDQHVRSCPKEIKSDADKLIPYLEEVSATDIEKARAIYVWLADNISYDAKSINKNKMGDNSPEGVFKSKKAVCAGYANLFEYLGKKMGLDIRCVDGYSKNDIDEDSWVFTDEDPDHAWNVIKINGEWRFFDATWGAGNGEDDNRGRLIFIKEYTDNWFNLNPYESIFTHYPEDTSFMLTEPKITLEKYETLQGIPIYAFKTKLLNAEKTYLKAVKKSSLKFPIIYPLDPNEFQVVDAPKEFRLRKRKPHSFNFFVTGVTDLFLYKNDEKFKEFEFNGEDNTFNLEFMSKEDAQIEIVIKTTEGKLFTILEYEVY